MALQGYPRSLVSVLIESAYDNVRSANIENLRSHYDSVATFVVVVTNRYFIENYFK